MTSTSGWWDRSALTDTERRVLRERLTELGPDRVGEVLFTLDVTALIAWLASPGAPNSLRARDKAPNINIGVNVNANPLSESEFDVVLTLNAKAEVGKEVLFNVELVYGGVFKIQNFPQEHMLPLLFIECPRLLFPFSRQIIAECTRNGGFPPLLIGPGQPHAAPVAVRGDVSSQFLTGLLQALPLLRESVTVQVTGELISRPYIDITCNLMRRFGVAVEPSGANAFRVPAGDGYTSPGTLAVEGDASGASYFLAAGVLGGGPVRVTGVGRDSIQGDVAFADVLARLGADVRFGPDWVETRAGGSLAGGDYDDRARGEWERAYSGRPPTSASVCEVPMSSVPPPTTILGMPKFSAAESRILRRNFAVDRDLRHFRTVGLKIPISSFDEVHSAACRARAW